jgi:bifunctional UDP-N-acetylglucosamine pyrophosphorylase/glucosamine-1-phosphate N-acetyltransferase
MKAVIPAAKKKESLFPFSDSKPTALMPLKGEPLILQTIEKLKSQGIEEIIVVVNYREELFKNLLGDRADVELVKQEDLSGTAKALEAAGPIEEDFLLINGDVVISEKDIENLIEAHEGGLSLLATDENKAEKFGVLSIQNDEIVELAEKPDEPENTLVNSGIYLFSPKIFETLESEDYSEITDLIAENIEETECRFKLIEDYWIDIGSPKRLWEADRVLRENELEAEISDESSIADSATIGENVRIEEGAEIHENSIIEEYTVIGENAEIGPNTVVRSSTVGHSSIIENCEIDKALLFEENIVDSYVSVENTVLGEETDVKSGTVIKESFIGPRSFIEMNNSVKGVKFVPDARTDISELSK